jgi:hypothetical protein
MASDTIPKFIVFVDSLRENMTYPQYWYIDKTTISMVSNPYSLYPSLKSSFGCSTPEELIDTFSKRYGIVLNDTQHERFRKWINLFELKSR